MIHYNGSRLESAIRILGKTIVTLCLAISGIGQANDTFNLAELKNQAIEQGLHDTDYWHALVHYYPSRNGLYPFESHVDDTRFFISERGKHDPQAELLATIDHVLSDNALTLNTAAKCRFIAREKWLRDSLSLPQLKVSEQCADYFTFRENMGAGSVTLVFPASYLNSPSSMFGHTLLRFDPENISDGSPLLSWSLNFAADVGDESMSAGFAFKGIAGGYPGRFNSIPYFEKLKEYGAIENRDIWEYKLDLTPEEIDRMLDHAWELTDISFDYFFFRQNCSFRLLELIDLARPGLNLADQFPYTAIPADTVKAVSNAGIVSEVNYRASQGTLLNHAIGDIPHDKRHWIEQVQATPTITQSKAFTSLAPRLQANIIKTANELLTFTSRKKRQVKETAKKRLELLKLISQLPDSANDKPQIPVPDAPDTGHETTTIAITRGRVDSSDYTEAMLRLSYHDILDPQTGYTHGAGIELGNLRLKFFDNDEPRLESFDVVHLQSFSDRHRQINSLSWEVVAGLGRNRFIESDRLAARVESNVGKSLRLSTNTLAYALLGSSAYQFIDPGEFYINAHMRLGVLAYPTFGASQIELTMNSVQTQSLVTSLSFTQNIPLQTNHALRLNATGNYFNDEFSEDFSLSYRYYF